MEHLLCVVERITYQNAENGYSVIKCRAKGRCSSSGRAFSADRSGSGDFSDLVTVVGSMPDVHVGSVLSLTGRWRVDAKYGRQFAMETFEETLPATVFGIEKYLGSGLIKGIGPKFAKKIVQEFGRDTLDVIEEDPDVLIRVAETPSPYHTGQIGADEMKAKLSHEEWLKQDLFERLAQSKFRSRFALRDADRQYIQGKSLPLIRTHAEELIRKRLAPAIIPNDGKQTPMRGAPKGHPIFIGQHATGTCCRGCLEKWHGIPKGRELTEEEQAYIVNVLMK